MGVPYLTFPVLDLYIQADGLMKMMCMVCVGVCACIWWISISLVQMMACRLSPA